jgi:polyphosphate kinase 2 (PPK2 family)
MSGRNEARRLPRQLYETELYRLQGELVKMQEWMRAEGARNTHWEDYSRAKDEMLGHT